MTDEDWLRSFGIDFRMTAAASTRRSPHRAILFDVTRSPVWAGGPQAQVSPQHPNTAVTRAAKTLPVSRDGFDSCASGAK